MTTTETEVPVSAAQLSADNSFPSAMKAVRKATNFEPRKASAFLSIEPEPMVWLWKPFLPAGALALLAAYMKIGKSTFVYPLVTAMAKGTEFLGYSTTPTRVLILAVEEHRRDVRARLERFGLQPDDAIYIHAGRLTPADFPEIKQFVVKERIGLVLLDTLSRYWQIGDENNNAEIIRSINPFLDLAHDTGTSVLLVHHESKAGGAGGRSIRGGSALFGIVDVALFLERRQGGADNQRILKTLGRYAESPEDLVIELKANQWLARGSAADDRHEQIKTAVEQAMDPQPRRIEELAIRAQQTQKATREALEELLNEGRARRQGSGVKGDPHTYCQPSFDWFPSQPGPVGKETNSAPATAAHSGERE
jgi:RecA-family ATPase